MMKWITIALALLGLGMGLYTVQSSRMTPPDLPLAGHPSLNPYAHGIAASGKVESASRDIAITATEPGIVVKVLVEVNQPIKAGEALFQLDARLLDAERVQAEAVLAVAKAELKKLEAQPRREDLLPLEAAVQQAKAMFEDAKDDCARAEQSFRMNAASEGEVQRKIFARQRAEAGLAEAQAERNRVAAGAWDKDLIITRANVDKAQAVIQAIQLRLDRLTVRSPIDGIVLKRNIEPGEYATPSAANPALVIGDLSHLRIRAQVDEEDTTRLRPGLASVAYLRGATRQQIPLTMLRIEPLAIPKRDLTGSIVEVVDTRVVEVLYEVTPSNTAPLYPGQLVDVYIDAPPPSNPPVAPEPAPSASQNKP